MFSETTIYKIFEKNYAFHVKQCTMGKLHFLLFKSFLLVLTIFPFQEEDEVLGNNPLNFSNKIWTFLIFLNFLRPWSISCSTTCKTTRIYEFFTNNQALFHLRRKENLRNCQKFSKYYEHDCLQDFLFLFISLINALIVKNSHILAGIYSIFLKKMRWTKF